MSYFNGLGMNLGNLSRISNAESRSITAENPDGSKSGGAKFIPREDDPVSYPATELGKGWKCQPYCQIKPGEIKTIADIDGPGAIQSIWCTGGISRFIILRIYWENQPVSTGGNTNMRFFCPAVGRSPSAAYQSGFLSRGKLHACCSEPPQRVERLLGDAIP